MVKEDYIRSQNELILSRLDSIEKLLVKHLNLNYCPICNDFFEFLDFGHPPRKNVWCPNCYSVERMRFTFLFIQSQLENKFSEDIKLLHFAPEKIFYDLFSKKTNIDYYPVDFDPERYERQGITIRKKVDMMDIPWDNKTFDVIYNSHVLEHVPDDIHGMSELYRVLKDDGVCITLAPVFRMETTLEKEEYNTPELRLKYYGQEDHLRKYGLDFKDRLESVGFKVDVIKSSDILSDSDKKLYAINDSDEIYLCTK